ncbi:hypothetical protein [Microvirga subterranea]|uniref:Uncharacterized protein (DUF2336 family) n=1 Tax=Microvirga subterranea TaxID=186651 RepID=A0A370HJK3_9HYPH|nr:hypothetical protein [Microvirga subterranea]RDI58679.1 uncharacterized protein (DUF2336 family) [Microvirga subterranea]
MAFPAKPDRWPDLSSIDDTEANGRDARASLLKVNAEMFVAAPARDREIIETFETLALGFLPAVDRASLAEIARILAPCEDTPDSVLDHLSRHSPEAREIVLKSAARLPVSCSDTCLGTPEGRLRLASCSALDRIIVERLLALREADVEDHLAANPAFVPTEPAFADLVRRAQDRAPLAAILLSRTDLSLADEAALYLAASREHRARIRAKIESALPHRRARLAFMLTEHDVAAFFAAARHGDVGQFEAMLTGALGFPAAAEWRILQAGRYELLALALRALGLCDKEATRIFLTLHPVLCRPLSTVKELVRTVRDVPSAVALALVEAILGVQALSGRSGPPCLSEDGDVIVYRPASASV